MKFLNYIRKGTTRVIVFIVIIYIFFTVGRSVLKNYQTNKDIARLSSEISEVNLVNEALNYQIAYYKTDTFKELSLRQRLDLQKEGEKMVVLPKHTDESQVKTPGNLDKKEVPKKQNYELWVEYFKTK